MRGVVLALLATTAGAPLVGLSLQIGALVGISSMLGDLLSSFVKRRLRMEPSARATGLDQIPESLLPLLVVREAMRLGPGEIAFVTGAFLIGEIALSRCLYRMHIRERPY